MNHYHEEEILGKAYDSRLARRLLKYLRPYRPVVAISILLLIIVSGLRLVGPYLTLVAIDRYIMTGDSAGLDPHRPAFPARSSISVRCWVRPDLPHELDGAEDHVRPSHGDLYSRPEDCTWVSLTEIQSVV